MSKRDDAVFLYHIFEACQNIITMLKGITLADFLKNQEKQGAVLWNFQVIGEATKQLSEKMTQKYSQVEWSLMARFRDKIVHHYFGIEFETVWNTAKTELPKVLSELEQIPELIEVRKKMMTKQFANLVFSLTGFTEPEEQEKELRRQLRILGHNRCLVEQPSSYEHWIQMTVPELVDMLLKIPEEKRQEVLRKHAKDSHTSARKKSPRGREL